jgi:hypothetical protein
MFYLIVLERSLMMGIITSWAAIDRDCLAVVPSNLTEEQLRYHTKHLRLYADKIMELAVRHFIGEASHF